MEHQTRPIDELLRTASLLFEGARAMPSSVYTSHEFLEQE